MVLRTMRLYLLPAILPAMLAAQKLTTFEGREGLLIDNDKVELVVLNRGGAFTSLLLKDDAEKLSPLWNPARASRLAGDPPRFGDSMGHFVCVDGFGPTSADETKAGFQGHGEAHRQPWQVARQGRSGNRVSVTFRTMLPAVQEVFTRKIDILDGEQVAYVESELESLVSFDRPINWAEHGTIGSPFLAPEATVVDASVGQCKTRPHNNAPQHRLASDKEFKYPAAPAITDGPPVNIRAVPPQPNSMDHTGCALDPSRRLVFVTALRTDKRLLFGYLLRREEYPWLQEWMNYPRNLNLARGLEFGTQPFDLPRRTIIDMHQLFGVPTYRWLPAKGKIGTKFLMFYTRVPEGFRQVDDVRQEAGKLVIQGSGQTITLASSDPL